VRERRDFYVRTIRWDVTWRAHCDDATREELALVIWQDYSDVVNWKYGANNRCTLGRRERGLGVLGESTEEVTWRDHLDDATGNVRVSLIWRDYSDVLI
jgi:hypothetical protein